MIKRSNIKGIITASAVIITSTAILISCDSNSSNTTDEATAHPQNEIAPTPAASELMSVDEAIKIVSGGGPPMRGIQALIALAEAEKPNVKAILWLGRFGVQSGQLDKAHKRFTDVLDLEPNHKEATWDLAMLDMEMGNYDEAVKGFRIHADLKPEDEKAHFFIGSCLESMDEKVEALEQYRIFLSLTSDSVLTEKVEGIINRLEVGINEVSTPNE
ncbi:MAG: hypothetical protein COA49_07655 [Bacteroidetes bacterium]|nr:MAG: hypothetical protein COA49_07655 [Bacteroidota bacterium]